MLPAWLSRDDYVPHFMRMMGATPAVYLLVGVGVWEAFQFLKERSFKNSGIKSAIVLAALATGLILTQGVSTFRTYFENWTAAPEMTMTYDVGWTKLAQTLNQLPSEAGIVYLIPRKRHGKHLGFEYLYNSAAHAQVIYTDSPSLAQQIEFALRPVEELSNVSVADWNPDAPWAGSGFENIMALLEKYGRYVGSAEHSGIPFHTFVEIDSDPPWTSYEYLEPLTVIYDGGIALHGFALGVGEDQLSIEGQANLGYARSFWLATQWQPPPGWR